MRRAQLALSRFLPLIDWSSFKRVNLNEEIRISDSRVAASACGDEAQAVVWLIRRDTIQPNGMLDRHARPVSPRLCLPGLAPGSYSITAWNTAEGAPAGEFQAVSDGRLEFTAPPFVADLALAVRRIV